MIVGLGNPGIKYETTRHNVGWLALDRLIDTWKADGPKSKFNAEFWTASVDGEKVILAKPQTFMNLSGQAIAPLAGYYKCTPDDIIVVYDEVDLKPGALRIKTGGGSGGHNGIKSLDQSLSSPEYHRVRIGIGHARSVHPGMDLADYVLGQFTQAECDTLDTVFGNVEKASRLLIAGELKKAMNVYNTAPKSEAG
jgi:PTH1 family peptidyl-tRNA hydrolase